MNELVFNMPASKYHAIDACSKSALTRFAITPRHCKTPQEPSDAMAMGTAFHTMILEPDVFAKYYSTYPEGKDGRSAEGKAAKKYMDATGGHILPKDKWQALMGMKAAIEEHSIASSLVAKSRHEVSLFWDHPGLGFPCKARTDIWFPEVGVIADLKKCTPSDFADLPRTIAKYKYHWQAAWYTQGARLCTNREDWAFLFVFVEDAPPHSIRIVQLSDNDEFDASDRLPAMEIAREELAKLMPRWAECWTSNAWPGYAEKIEIIDLPNWASRKKGIDE